MKKLLIFSMFAIVALLSFAPVASALHNSITPWSTYRHDAAHSGSTASDVPSTNSTLWAWSTQSVAGSASLVSSPIVVDGRVIVDALGSIFALDETTGVELWKRQTSMWQWFTAPASADGRVFFGYHEESGGVLCLNLSTGVEIWNRDASPGNVNSAPLVHRGVVYAGLTDNYTRAFNATTGLPMWGYRTNGPIYSSPTADEDMIYFGSDDGRLYALNITSSAPLSVWNFTANGAIRSTPVVDGGRIFFGSDNHMLYALNKTTGGLIWSWATTDTGIKLRNSVAVANNIVYVTSLYNGNVYALRADVVPGSYTETSTEIRYWTKTLEGYALLEPVYAGGKLLVATTTGDPGHYYALEASTGNILWDRQIKWWLGFGNPVAADGRVFHTLYQVDPFNFFVYCLGSPFPPTINHYAVTVGGQNYDVAVETNSTVTNFNTTSLTSVGELNFKVQGIGTTGMSNITIPKALLNGAFNVTVDGGQPWYLAPVSGNSTHSSLYFTYNGTPYYSHVVKITGTTFIPEFPTGLVLPLAVACLSLVALKLRKPHKLP